MQLNVLLNYYLIAKCNLYTPTNHHPQTVVGLSHFFFFGGGTSLTLDIYFSILHLKFEVPTTQNKIDFQSSNMLTQC